MYYIWYDNTTGEIKGQSEDEPYEYFDHYITSEINPIDYGCENCSVVNGELVISLNGYKYKAKNQVSGVAEEFSGFEVDSGKYVLYFDREKMLLYKAYYETARGSYVLPVLSDISSGEESSIVFSTQSEINSVINAIIDHITEVEIFKAQTKDAINSATTKEELDAISLTAPSFSLS